MAHDVFISHAHADKAVADLVCATLEQRGIRCWIAPRDIRPGADWGSAIVAAIRESRAMVLVFSDAANASRHIPRELERAIDREIPIVPFRLENIAPRGSLEYNLALVHWLDAVTPPLEAHANRLADVVAAMLGTPEPHAAPRLVTPVVDERVVNPPAGEKPFSPVLDVPEPGVSEPSSPEPSAPEPGIPEPARIEPDEIDPLDKWSEHESGRPQSRLRMILLIAGALTAAAVGIAWGVSRHNAAAVEPPAAVVPNDPAAAPADQAPSPTNAAPPTNADTETKAVSDAEMEAWRNCNGADQSAIIAGCTALIDAKRFDAPTTGRAFFNRGGVYYAQANYDAAIADYTKALELDFEPPVTHNNRGLSFAAKRDYARAGEDYDLSVQANPAFGDAYRNRGQMYTLTKNYSAAAADFTKAIGLDPENTDLRYARTVVYLLQRDSEKALADAAVYITKKPDDAFGYHLRGIGFFQRGLMVLAKEDFARALKVDPSDARALYGLGAAREMSGDSGGKNDVAAALKIDPAIADVMTALGVVRK